MSSSRSPPSPPWTLPGAAPCRRRTTRTPSRAGPGDPGVRGDGAKAGGGLGVYPAWKTHRLRLNMAIYG